MSARASAAVSDAIVARTTRTAPSTAPDAARSLMRPPRRCTSAMVAQARGPLCRPSAEVVKLHGRGSLVDDLVREPRPRARRGSRRAGAGRIGADRPGHHHRLLRRREVDGDGRVRGRGLLLRRQPPLGDDPDAGRAVHAQRLQGRPGGGRLRRSRRQLLRGPGGDARRSARDRRQAPRAVPRGRGADAADPLQGDPAPAPAGPDGQRHRRDRAGAQGAGAAARARRRGDRHHRADRGDAPAQAGR